MKKILTVCAVASLFVGDAGAMYFVNPEACFNEGYRKAQADAERRKQEEAQKSPLRRKFRRVCDVCSGVANLVEGVGKLGSTAVLSSMYSVALFPTAWSIWGRNSARMFGCSPAVSSWTAGLVVSFFNVSLNGYEKVLDKGNKFGYLVSKGFNSGASNFSEAIGIVGDLINTNKKRLSNFVQGTWENGLDAIKIKSLEEDKAKLNKQKDAAQKAIDKLYDDEYSLVNIEAEFKNGDLSGKQKKKWNEIKSRYLKIDEGYSDSDRGYLDIVRGEIERKRENLESRVNGLSKEISPISRKLVFYKIANPFLKVGSFANGAFKDGVKIANVAWNLGVGTSLFGLSALGSVGGFPMLLASCAPGIVGSLAYDGLKNFGFLSLHSWMIAEGVVFLSDFLVNGASVWKKFGNGIVDGLDEGLESIDTGLDLLFPFDNNNAYAFPEVNDVD